MIGFKSGDIALVHFPFTDLTTTKRRPAWILNTPAYSSAHGDLVLLALTSQPQTDPRSALVNWNAAGLPKPTRAKPVIGTISGALVLRILGRIDSDDIPAIRYILSQTIASEWFNQDEL